MRWGDQFDEWCRQVCDAFNRIEQAKAESDTDRERRQRKELENWLRQAFDEVRDLMPIGFIEQLPKGLGDVLNGYVFNCVFNLTEDSDWASLPEYERMQCVNKAMVGVVHKFMKYFRSGKFREE